MITKTIDFIDFRGNDRQAELNFNLTAAELMELEVGFQREGGMNGVIETMGKTDDQQFILNAFKTIIQKSYGIRTNDDRFIKNTLEWETFQSSEAYSTFLMSLMSDPDEASAFMEAIVHSGTNTLQTANMNREQRRAAQKNRPAQHAGQRPQPQDRRPRQQNTPTPYEEVTDVEIVEEEDDEPQGTNIFEAYETKPTEIPTSPAVVDTAPQAKPALTAEQLQQMTPQQINDYYTN